MKFNTQNIKELLDKGANLIIDDDMPVEELRYIAQIAANNEREITIIAQKWNLEDLKRIASDGKGYVTLDIKGD